MVIPLYELELLAQEAQDRATEIKAIKDTMQRVGDERIAWPSTTEREDAILAGALVAITVTLLGLILLCWHFAPWIDGVGK